MPVVRVGEVVGAKHGKSSGVVVIRLTMLAGLWRFVAGVENERVSSSRGLIG